MAITFSRYVYGSIASVILMIYYAYYTQRQFYPVILFLVSSKVSFIIGANMLLALALIFARFFKRIYFGDLRLMEVELLVERAKYTITETCLALTIFRNELTPPIIALFGLLIFVKLLHKLAKSRLEYLEQVMPVSYFTQARFWMLLLTMIGIDIAGAYFSTNYILTHGRSVLILFGFEFGLLLIYAFNLSVRFLLQVVDASLTNGMASKGFYTMLVDLICEIIKFITYVSFFCLLFVYYGVPLHIMRDVWHAFSSFQRKLVSFVTYLKLTRNLDNILQDATPEELVEAHNCLVCREDMDRGKKLPCGHIFHMDCLRMWLQHQQSCPLCRAAIPVSAPADTAAARRERAAANNNAAEARAGAGNAPIPAGDLVNVLGENRAAVPVIAPANPPVAGGGDLARGGGVAADGRVPNAAVAAEVGGGGERGVTNNRNTSSAVSASIPSSKLTADLNSSGVQQSSFPMLFIVQQEPIVSVRSDPMFSGAEIRKIPSGTVVFISSRVKDADGCHWLKAPDGWICECAPGKGLLKGDSELFMLPFSSGNQQLKEENTAEPLKQSTAGNFDMQQTKAERSFDGSNTAAASRDNEQAQKLNSSSSKESGARKLMENNSPSSSSKNDDGSPRTYSRRDLPSRYLAMEASSTNKKEDSSGLSPGQEYSSSSSTRRPPFSANLDGKDDHNDNIKYEMDGRISHDTSSGDYNHRITEQTSNSMGALMDVQDMLQHSRDLLSARSTDLFRIPRNQQSDSNGSRSTTPTRDSLGNDINSTGMSRAQRLRQLITFQTQIQDVSQNLALLNQSIITCQQSLSVLIKDELQHIESEASKT